MKINYLFMTVVAFSPAALLAAALTPSDKDGKNVEWLEKVSDEQYRSR